MIQLLVDIFFINLYYIFISQFRGESILRKSEHQWYATIRFMFIKNVYRTIKSTLSNITINFSLNFI